MPATNGTVERLDQIETSIREIQTELHEHIEREETVFASAFPSGDFESHRRAHEAMMLAANEQEKFWREMRLSLAKHVMIGGITLLIGLVMAGVGVALLRWRL